MDLEERPQLVRELAGKAVSAEEVRYVLFALDNIE